MCVFTRKELAKAQAECRTQRLLNLSESQKLVDLERRFYASEQQCESLTSQLERAKLSLEELRLKYEPGLWLLLLWLFPILCLWGYHRALRAWKFMLGKVILSQLPIFSRHSNIMRYIVY